MKIGDLVKVEPCPRIIHCNCFFCSRNSNCIGVVVAPSKLNMWYVMFDVGEWEVDENEVRVINNDDK